MPYKSEKIKLQGLQDRRRKLTDTQKEEIRELYATGLYSLNRLAKQYEVSKKTILLTVNPESKKVQDEYIKNHWRDFQHSREERTEAARKVRRYKQELYLRGELKEETENPGA